MILFNYETDFNLNSEKKISFWIKKCVKKENAFVGEINYIFCNDEYLHKINLEFLQHDTLTDIISFDYTEMKKISGDIFISIDRVNENAKLFNVSFKDELHRVIIHGILHFLGYKDKTKDQKNVMRAKENECIEILKQL